MNDYIRLDVADLESAIAEMLVQFPEIEDDEQLRADMMEGAGLHDVIAKLLDREREAKSMVGAVQSRIDELDARKARYERQVGGWRALILRLMERANVPKVTLPEGTLSITHRKPEPVVVDEAVLPERCWKVTRAPDKTAIKEWWKFYGAPPVGTVLNNGSTSLSVRSK